MGICCPNDSKYVNPQTNNISQTQYNSTVNNSNLFPKDTKYEK